MLTAIKEFRGLSTFRFGLARDMAHKARVLTLVLVLAWGLFGETQCHGSLSKTNTEVEDFNTLPFVGSVPSGTTSLEI